jgi:hypothetical protein
MKFSKITQMNANSPVPVWEIEPDIESGYEIENLLMAEMEVV